MIRREEMSRWKDRAKAVVIVRDTWGIAHVSGPTDADAVFGMIYAQAEDDFQRIETNYLLALGRLAEAEGEQAIYQDLRVRLFVDEEDLKVRYAASEPWLQTLMAAWADGLNYYLAMHPEVAPRVIRRFEPWMALGFYEGGVLGDLARIAVDDLQSFYGRNERAGSAHRTPIAEECLAPESLGSNAFAIAPGNTVNGHALLLINPHPDFYLRTEMHVQSGEGLNCYGAVTWGQFFVYQGFNERAGWAHTSSGADTVDEYAETIVARDEKLFYRYDGGERAVRVAEIAIRYRSAAGALEDRRFKVYRTHHGPIVRQAQGQWISIALMYKPVEALTQAFLRMKARSYAQFVEISRLKANSVANTTYADAEGNIAFWPPQFIPRRDDRFDFTQPVDGCDPATEWRGEHELAELPSVLNPVNGWIENTNDEPYAVAGSCSPKAADYPRYLDTSGRNPRGVNAERLLQDRRDFTLESLIEAAYDPFLSAFADLLPSLVAAYDELPTGVPHQLRLSEPIEILRHWDYRQGVDSVATSLAVLWGEQAMRDVEPVARTRSVELASMFDYLHQGRVSATLTYRALLAIHEYIAFEASSELKLTALEKICSQLTTDFGSWRTPWGQINRFQRLNGEMTQRFNDAQSSTPVALVSSIWGALASFKTRQQGTQRRYGVSGNGFVAAVEFAETVRARAIGAGGVSSHPESSHFNDQAARFTTGALREVYFYPEQIEDHTERVYHPGA